MSDDTTAVAPETGASDDTSTEQVQNATETVEHWKEKARLQEKRAKENAAAAKRLAEIEEAQKSEAEKTADRIAKAEAEAASVPAKVALALKEHLVAIHKIDSEDAELFLTAAEPELLLKQVARFVGQSDKSKSNHVPSEGRTSRTPLALNGDGLEQALRSKLGID